MLTIRRAGWGAAAPKEPLTPWPLHQPSGYTVHWEGAGGHSDHSLCALEVKMIQLYHQTHGYSDIAYNWIICLHGVIYEGRPAGQFQSAAQLDGNPTHIAVCFMWGPQWHLTPQAQAALVALIQVNILPAIGHMDEPSCRTSCPEDEIETLVHGLPVLLSSPGPRIPVTPGGTPVPKPLPPEGIHHPVLAQGTNGPAVGELQRKLRFGCGQEIAVDGLFGPKTKTAVENVQRFCHLAVDGIAGPKTWLAVDFAAASHGVH